ncbi:SRPBCC family protein [Comamonas guangdongensis]|uniref:SRPBCC family protein n=1 Tax=Comamonas guangdongensis TaxID=510515 RepID=A0ABV3ZW57_9BURK
MPLLLWVCHAAWTQELSIETSDSSGVIMVSASADMRVQPATAWSVISDYDHLADFLPNMRSSRVVQRNGNQLVLEQTGVFGFLFFQQPIQVRLAVTESPPRRIVAHAVGGNLKQMDGSYTLETLPDGKVRLSYAGRLLPDFTIPPLVGKLVVRKILARQFVALVGEILRREARAAPQTPPAQAQ